MNMKELRFTALLAAILLLAGCGKGDVKASFPYSVSSPDGVLTAYVGMTPEGQPCYKLERNGSEVVAPSRLGFQLVPSPQENGDDPVIKNARQGLKFTDGSETMLAEDYGYSLLEGIMKSDYIMGVVAEISEFIDSIIGGVK